MLLPDDFNQKSRRKGGDNFELKWVLFLASVLVVVGALGFLLEISGGTAVAISGAVIVRDAVNRRNKGEDNKK